ncbi:MAG: hypothetical protein QXP04_05070 [Candidatus Nanoarchaeia archaeon]
MRVLIQVLEGLNNSNEIEDFIRFWEPKLGRCGKIQIQPFINWAGHVKTINKNDPTNVKIN